MTPGDPDNVRESQSQRAYRIIEEMIVSLELPPGSRISEQSLSSSLDIGRTPVREALQRLAQEGSLRIQPRSGAVVSRLDVEDNFKLIEVRRQVERLLVDRCARLADGGVRKEFLELRDRFLEAEETGDELTFMSADREFNGLVASAADNEYAAKAMGPIQAQTRRFWFLNFQRFGDLAKVSRLHAEIADAIADNDRATACARLDALLDYVEEYTFATKRALEREGDTAASG